MTTKPENRAFWSEALQQADTLPDEELRRHALVSRDNKHECRDCFTCACLVIARQRGILSRLRVLP
jgi:hypothetical protein